MGRILTILGDGAWGSAMAWVLAQRPGRQVRLLGTRPQNTLQFQKTRENARLLPGVKMPDSVTIFGCSHPVFANSAETVSCHAACCGARWKACSGD